MREFDFAFINEFQVMALCRNLWVATAGTFVAPQGLISHSLSFCEFDFALNNFLCVGYARLILHSCPLCVSLISQYFLWREFDFAFISCVCVCVSFVLVSFVRGFLRSVVSFCVPCC